MCQSGFAIKYKLVSSWNVPSSSQVYSVTWKLSYTLKICLALQGGIFVLNTQPKPASSLWKTQAPSIDVQLVCISAMVKWSLFCISLQKFPFLWDGRLWNYELLLIILTDLLAWLYIGPFCLAEILRGRCTFVFFTHHCIVLERILAHFQISFTKLGVQV